MAHAASLKDFDISGDVSRLLDRTAIVRGWPKIERIARPHVA